MALFVRQPDMPGPVQAEHQAPADHVAQGPVGLDPVPCPAQFFRQGPAAVGGVLGDQRIDKSDVLSADVPSSIGKHECLNSTAAAGTQA